MTPVFKLVFGFVTIVVTAMFLFLLISAELNSLDLTFAKYFGLFIAFSAISFLLLTRGEDNEETKCIKKH
ncbi:MAG: hypothetical protein HYY52_01815 [Candidatus Melainabacteria bacterium]|nr:hypothetical protein [Candidatus Melainabacteria bacterium]